MNIIEIWMDGHSKSRAMMNFPICQSFSFFFVVGGFKFQWQCEDRKKDLYKRIDLGCYTSVLLLRGYVRKCFVFFVLALEANVMRFNAIANILDIVIRKIEAVTPLLKGDLAVTVLIAFVEEIADAVFERL